MASRFRMACWLLGIIVAGLFLLLVAGIFAVFENGRQKLQGEHPARSMAVPVGEDGNEADGGHAGRVPAGAGAGHVHGAVR